MPGANGNAADDGGEAQTVANVQKPKATLTLTLALALALSLTLRFNYTLY